MSFDVYCQKENRFCAMSPMHSDRTLVELVGLVYDAAGDAGQWTPFVERLAQVLNMPWTFSYVHDFADGKVAVQAEVGFDPAYRRSYEAYYAARNPTLTRGRDRMSPGAVCRTETFCPDVFFRSELSFSPDGLTLAAGWTTKILLFHIDDLMAFQSIDTHTRTGNVKFRPRGNPN